MLPTRDSPSAVRYVFTDEVEAYYRSGKFVIIYNHRDRRPRGEYEKKILAHWEYVEPPGDIKILRFKRVSVRDYIFLIQERHRGLVNRSAARLTSPPHDFLFKQYYGHSPHAKSNPPVLDKLFDKAGKKMPVLVFTANGLWALTRVIQAANSLDPAVVKAKWE